MQSRYLARICIVLLVLVDIALLYFIASRLDVLSGLQLHNTFAFGRTEIEAPADTLVIQIDDKEKLVIDTSDVSRNNYGDWLISSGIIYSELEVQKSDSLSDVVHVDDLGYIKNCESKKYNLGEESVFIIDHDMETVVLEDLIGSKNAELISLCNNYIDEKYVILNEFPPLQAHSQVFDTVLGFKANTEEWYILDEEVILDTLTNFIGIDVNDEENNSTIVTADANRVLLDKPDPQLVVDTATTLNTFRTWLKSPQVVEPKVETMVMQPEIPPQIYDYDFSKVLGVGRTRIDLIRNGQGNYAVKAAEDGLEEVQYTILMPGEEFSFLDEIARQPGTSLTKSGRFIGAGYCNSTTTLFRAALESGLKITDRTNHGYNIPSYDWGYPINTVDAVMWAGDEEPIDLKFKNNYEYPIMIYFNKNRDDTFQYHTVEIRGPQSAPQREVELHDWKKWDEFSPTSFKASFKQTVKENGVIILEEEFYSHYIDR